jgi:hypothetical protein
MVQNHRRISRAMFVSAAALVSAAAVMTTTPTSASAAGATFNFAYVGDMPYGQAATLPAVADNVPAVMNAWVNDLNADPNIQFTAHSGDAKSGSDTCADANVDNIFSYFNSLKKPFWYTPGDNDWTDCHRNNNGAFNPLERLSHVRTKYFSTPTQTAAGLTHLTVNSQASSSVTVDQEFVENTWFQRDCVTFGDVHSVTSANGLLRPITTAGGTSSSFVDTPTGQADRDAEVARRSSANINWVDTIFDTATANNSEGVFLMLQAEPTLLSLQPGGLPTGEVSAADEYAGLRARILARAATFGKPVVIAHGDQHNYTVTQNYGGLANVTRLENFGSNASATVAGARHWIEVKAECGTPDLFSQRSRDVGIAPTNVFAAAFPTAPAPVVPEGPLALGLLGLGAASLFGGIVVRRRSVTV